ncbi:uncharacterized protein N7483_003456 [Penicillium malachiteum]|uniref:uncharacterized protein n=1 Tax=Penicillium malachiteum TaxID=1324776 RepID=UPI0025498E4C|nr:uncharacterized protein N7483_003456 [Penicillium malachiteum]KAJ5728948.1 hypothetical protein N7483_003456 [Penicillium malachiteum]
MYLAIIKRQCLRPSAVCFNQLSRASVHGKAQSGMKGDEDFFVTTTFPDDFEASPLKAELLQKQAEAEASSGPWDEATIEQHKKDIYESLYPHEANDAMNQKSKQKTPPEPEAERAPNMDEL